MARKKSIPATAEVVFQLNRKLAKLNYQSGAVAPDTVIDERRRCDQKMAALAQDERLKLVEMLANEAAYAGDAGAWALPTLGGLIGPERAMFAVVQKTLPFAATGKKNKDGGSKGVKIVGEKTDKKRDDTRATYHKVKAEDPGLPETAVKRRVASITGRSLSTVHRHLRKSCVKPSV